MCGVKAADNVYDCVHAEVIRAAVPFRLRGLLGAIALPARKVAASPVCAII